jgi:acyl-coenzyme A synthetase/AMP-(fatty) acid ligase
MRSSASTGCRCSITYAATEFGGGVAGWNLKDHQQLLDRSSAGSVGRAHAGCELRVVAPESGEPLGADVARSPRGEGSASWATISTWNRTTDLARLDADGFLWILGRADQAIIRGGFKVLPDDVRVALERDPRVHSAAVVGMDDPRLGAVPVAAVELRPGSGPVSRGTAR